MVGHLLRGGFCVSASTDVVRRRRRRRPRTSGTSLGVRPRAMSRGRPPSCSSPSASTPKPIEVCRGAEGLFAAAPEDTLIVVSSTVKAQPRARARRRGPRERGSPFSTCPSPGAATRRRRARFWPSSAARRTCSTAPARCWRPTARTSSGVGEVGQGAGREVGEQPPSLGRGHGTVRGGGARRGRGEWTSRRCDRRHAHQLGKELASRELGFGLLHLGEGGHDLGSSTWPTGTTCRFRFSARIRESVKWAKGQQGSGANAPLDRRRVEGGCPAAGTPPLGPVPPQRC